MNPTIRIAQRACEAAKARQAVVVWFDEHGQYAVASYGETKAECTAVKPVCNAIGDMLDSGYLEPPGLYAGDDRQPDRRRGELGGWNEYDKLRRQRDEALARAAPAGTTVLGVPLDKARELLSDVLLHRAMRDESAMDDALDQLEELLLPEHARERRAAQAEETT